MAGDGAAISPDGKIAFGIKYPTRRPAARRPARTSGKADTERVGRGALYDHRFFERGAADLSKSPRITSYRKGIFSPIGPDSARTHRAVSNAVPLLTCPGSHTRLRGRGWQESGVLRAKSCIARVSYGRLRCPVSRRVLGGTGADHGDGEHDSDQRRCKACCGIWSHYLLPIWAFPAGRGAGSAVQSPALVAFSSTMKTPDGGAGSVELVRPALRPYHRTLSILPLREGPGFPKVNSRLHEERHAQGALSWVCADGPPGGNGPDRNRSKCDRHHRRPADHGLG